ncbi:hypothetical protein HDV01_001047 [Terramyces sp. JEL0728]|nr:hypothetical protein HDV01_001047 [Terramyces sp. JEL0728]
MQESKKTSGKKENERDVSADHPVGTIQQRRLRPRHTRYTPNISEIQTQGLPSQPQESLPNSNSKKRKNTAYLKPSAKKGKTGTISNGEKIVIWVKYHLYRAMSYKVTQSSDISGLIDKVFRALPHLEKKGCSQMSFSLHIPPSCSNSEMKKATLGEDSSNLLASSCLVADLGIAGSSEANALILHKLSPQDSSANVTFTFGRSQTADAVKEYMSLAEQLKDTKEVNDMAKIIKDNDNVEDSPFIVMVGSSGIGKTQMAFNLKAKGFTVVYLPLITTGDEGAQTIYRAYLEHTRAFQECIKRDFEDYTKRVKENKSDTGVRLDAFHCYGLLLAMLNDSSQWRMQSALKNELFDKLEMYERENRVVVFFDEFPAHDRFADNTEELRFMRNVYREIGVTVIIASTNSAATNLLKGKNSASRSGIWCNVFPLYINYIVPKDVYKIPWLMYLLKHSRPLFAQAAYSYWKSYPTVSLSISYLTGMFKAIFNLMSNFWKNSKYDAFTHGQICLLLSAHSIDEMVYHKVNGIFDDQVHSKKRNPGNTLVASSQNNIIIAKHYSNLEEYSPFQLLKDGTSLYKVSDGEAWTPKTRFLGPEKDLLLHLVSMGCGDDVPFKGTFAEAYSDTLEYQSFKLPIRNLNQESNDGQEREAIVCATLVLASRYHGLELCDWIPFLKRFAFENVLEFSNNHSKSNHIDQEVIPLLSGKVPFLGFPEVQWPHDLERVLGMSVGTIKRCLNSDKFDINVEKEMIVNGKSQWKKVFTVEVKDRKAPFGWRSVANTFARIPDGSKIHLIVINTLIQKFSEIVEPRKATKRAGNVALIPGIFPLKIAKTKATDNFARNILPLTKKQTKKGDNLSEMLYEDVYEAIEEQRYDELVGNNANLAKTLVCRFDGNHFHKMEGIINKCRCELQDHGNCKMDSLIIVIPLCDLECPVLND